MKVPADTSPGGGGGGGAPENAIVSSFLPWANTTDHINVVSQGDGDIFVALFSLVELTIQGVAHQGVDYPGNSVASLIAVLTFGVSNGDEVPTAGEDGQAITVHFGEMFAACNEANPDLGVTADWSFFPGAGPICLADGTIGGSGFIGYLDRESTLCDMAGAPITDGIVDADTLAFRVSGIAQLND